MQLSGKDLTDARQVAKLMQSWMTGAWPVYCSPLGIDDPKVIARLEEDYFNAPLDRVEGRYTVVGQIDAVLTGDDRVSVIRAIPGSPPTKLEVDTTVEALGNFVESAKTLGVTLEPDEFVHRAPAVVIRPLAIFR
jgi:hypothetical protein